MTLLFLAKHLSRGVYVCRDDPNTHVRLSSLSNMCVISFFIHPIWNCVYLLPWLVLFVFKAAVTDVLPRSWRWNAKEFHFICRSNCVRFHKNPACVQNIDIIYYNQVKWYHRLWLREILFYILLLSKINRKTFEMKDAEEPNSFSVASH